MNGNDKLVFAEETSDEYKADKRPWKILIADDEEEVHVITHMVLEHFTFEGCEIQLLGAYSKEETKAILREQPDIAVVLLDVVMEEDTAGLEIVRFVREELQNKFVRIILRTGQPGHAPERKIAMEYDINDYKEKTELTAQKLFTTLTASLRAYRDLKTIDRSRKGLEKIVSASADLFEMRSLKQFVSGTLAQLIALLHFDEDSLYVQSSGFAVSLQQEEYYVLAATGQFEHYVDKPMAEVVPEEIRELLMQAAEQQQSFFSNNVYVGYFRTKSGSENMVYLQGRREINDLDQNLINTLSTNIAVAFDNLYLHREIEETQKEVILTLGEVVETRSSETGHHVKRVGEYAYLLAEKYGLGQETAILLRISAPMHDVGKIGIPDTILNKPGPLTEQEFEIIKTHTTIGYDILKGSHEQILKAAAVIALQHHERWNGLGYPQGLNGEQIDIFGRIVKLVDVFDALSFYRIYKEIWDLERILAFIRQERGTHFDPALVDLFLDNLEAFLEIREAYPATHI